MPTHIPRSQPTRKKEQLLNCSEYLRLAIFHNKSQIQIDKRAEKYRVAHISLLKAKIHVWQEDREYPKDKSVQKIETLEKEMEDWKQAEIPNIIRDFKLLKGIIR